MITLLEIIDGLESIPITAKFRPQMERAIRMLLAVEDHRRRFPGPTEPAAFDLIPGVQFTRMQERLLKELKQRGKAGASRDQCLAAMYYDRPADWPESKIVDVVLCKIRKRLPGSGWRIRTVWGRVLVLERDDA